MPLYHITYNQGRTDNIVLESTTYNKIIDFFKQVSTASITMIKEIVFSKEHNISYTTQTYINEPFYREVRIYAQSKKYSKIITLRFVKKSVTDDQISKNIKMYCLINGEKIEYIHNIIRFNNVVISNSIQ